MLRRRLGLWRKSKPNLKGDLNADGVVVETNHPGIYLGDRKFELKYIVVMQALNEKAVVYIYLTQVVLTIYN